MARVPGLRKQRDRIMVGLEPIRDDLPADVKDAMALRAATWVQGECPRCGAKRKLVAHPEFRMVSVTFLHDDACPVSDLLDADEP